MTAPQAAGTLEAPATAAAPTGRSIISTAAPAFAAVLFDMDGSLVDTEPMWHAAELDFMTSHGSDWTAEDQAIALGGPIARVGRYLAQRLAADGVVGVTAEQAMAELLWMFEQHLDAGEIAVHDGAEALLREAMASGVPLALVSNSTRRLMDIVLAANPGLRFDVTIAGDEVPLAKPHPGPYLEAAERLGVSIAACLVVEDSPTGVAAARDSGAAVVAVQHLGQLDPGPRGLVVQRLDGWTLAGLAARLLPQA